MGTKQEAMKSTDRSGKSVTTNLAIALLLLCSFATACGRGGPEQSTTFLARVDDSYVEIPVSFAVLGPNDELKARLELISPSLHVPTVRSGTAAIGRIYIGDRGLSETVYADRRLERLGVPSERFFDGVRLQQWPNAVSSRLPDQFVSVIRYQSVEIVVQSADRTLPESLARSIRRNAPASS